MSKVDSTSHSTLTNEQLDSENELYLCWETPLTDGEESDSGFSCCVFEDFIVSHDQKCLQRRYVLEFEVSANCETCYGSSENCFHRMHSSGSCESLLLVSSLLWVTSEGFRQLPHHFAIHLSFFAFLNFRAPQAYSNVLGYSNPWPPKQLPPRL